MSGAAIQFAVQLLLSLLAPVAVYMPFACCLRGRRVYWNLAISGLALFSGLQSCFLTPLIASAVTINLLHLLIHLLLRHERGQLPK